MRLISWLSNLYQHFSRPTNRIGTRRMRVQRAVASVFSERLEPRQLLTTGVAAAGFETRVNTDTSSHQSLPSVAMNATGNDVVVWSSSGQDGSGYGVYAQRYNSAGVAQGTEFKVNTYTTGDQISAKVAMDAAGDFVVTWQSTGQDGSGYGLYAQRYNSSGVAQGAEFRVNTYTTGAQSLPSVAMDSAGAFVVTWQSNLQDGNSYGIYAQRYSAAGAAQGSEFLVNSYTTNSQLAPAVAMDSAGDFVITWSSYTQDGSQYGVYAQRFNSAGTAQGSAFEVNTYTTGQQNATSVAMDAGGDFVISWQSSMQDGGGYGVFAQRYNSTGVAQGSEFQVNTYTTGDQEAPSVAMDSAGDFVIAWQSNAQDGNSWGVYAQRYDDTGTAQGSEFRVNTYTTIAQDTAAIAMDAAGDFAIAWQSFDQDGSGYGIYSQRYVATVGPIVTGVFDGGGPIMVQPGQTVASAITSLSLDLSDSMNVVPGGANSVINRSNYLLMRYGVDVSNLISGITFGFNSSMNRYVAVVSFSTPLTDGGYEFIARQSIQDSAGRILDGEADGIPGGDFRLNFYVAEAAAAGSEVRVNTYTTSRQSDPKIAMDAAGDYVAVWQSSGQDGSVYGIYAQRYNSAGVAQGAEFQVNTYTTNNQDFASVAMDATGAFVITWESFTQDGSNFGGIYAQRYNAAGVAQGSEFQVNTSTMFNQYLPVVAMDAVGDFVISWTSNGEDNSSTGIYAQRYNAAGVAQGGQFQVNTYTTNGQTNPAVAMDAAGDFVVTWQSYHQDGSNYGIFARRYSAAGAVLSGEIQVNTYTTGDQSSPSVSMDAAGDFVTTWISNGQDGSGYGVYAQRYSAAGNPQGGEFRVNTTTTGQQDAPTASMNAAGDFVITWQSASAGISGIYGQRYDTAGVAQGGEFQVNTYTTWQQSIPVVAMDVAGDFVVAWSSYGQDGSQDGVYLQRYQSDIAPWIYQIEPTPLNAAGPLSTPITSSLLVFDADSNNLTGATIQIGINYRSGEDLLGFTNAATPHITGSWNATTGTLTLSGTDTVADYRTALHNVTYHDTSATPNTALTRTIDFQVTDGVLLSDVVSRDVTVLATSAPAVLSGVSGTGTYDENDPPLTLGANIVITDPNAVNLASATVSFTNWQAEDRVSFNNIFALQHTFNQNLAAHTASLVITGADTVYDYQVLLRSVVYSDVSDNPVTTPRIASFVVNDGHSNSNSVSRTTNVGAINDPPVLSGIETTPLAYKANDPAFPPQAISATLLVGDPDSTNCTKAIVQITSGYENDANGKDVLSFVNQLGITGSFNATTGTLTLTGTSSDGNYRTALRSVTFSSSGTAVSTATRTLTLTATDDFSPTPATSGAITRFVTVSTTNVPPALSGIPTTVLAYVRGTSATAVAPGLFVLDPDSVNMAGATIQVTTNYQNGQDVLAFTSGFGVTGSFVAATGTLTLTGTTSLANYQTLLRSVTFKTNTSGASTSTRTISFTVNDGLASSNPVTRNVALT